MNLQEIVKKFDMLNIFEKRRITDEYVELVFYNKDIDKWSKIFTDILEPALKPQGVKPTKDVQHLAKDYGGIYTNQTLFKKEFDNGTIIAMFWPWQDGLHATLKIILLNK